MTRSWFYAFCLRLVIEATGCYIDTSTRRGGFGLLAELLNDLVHLLHLFLQGLDVATTEDVNNKKGQPWAGAKSYSCSSCSLAVVVIKV